MSAHDGEVLTGNDSHRPVCHCGWVGGAYPLGYLDTARSILAAHQAVHFDKERT